MANERFAFRRAPLGRYRRADRGAGLDVRTAQTPAPRPMTFLDMQQMRQVGATTPSPDGKWMLYTLSTPDWKEAKRQTDIYLVSLQQGVASTRQMTFTKEKNETSPRWAHDGSFFVFLSNREAPESASSRNQLYVMRPDGGEARRITDTKEGVSDFAFSEDGRWLAYPQRQDRRRTAVLGCRATCPRPRWRNRSPSIRPACAPGSGRPTASASIS